MKLLIPLVAASIVSAVNGQSLADKWSIAEPAYFWEPEPEQYVQYGCTGYLQTSRFVKRLPDVPMAEGNVKTCSDACKAEGYEYFGFECPMSTKVHCQCYSEEKISDEKAIESADCKSRVGRQGDKHCTGDAFVDGFSMGGADIGSIYKVESGEASNNLIELNYDVSTLMTADNAVVKIYDSECGAGGNEITAGFGAVLSGLDGPVLSGTEFELDGKTAELDLTLALETMAQNPDLYTETQSETEGKGAVMVFCIRFGLFTTGGEDGLEVNFLENVITLNIDLQAGFEVAAFNVAPKDKIEATATQTYTVDAKLCTGTGTTFAEKTRAPDNDTFNQGEAITVCVYPGAEAQQDGLIMESVLDFTWSRDDDVTTLDQLAIVGSAAENDMGLTSYDNCSSGDVCVFSTILLAQYYVEIGNVDGSGQATLAFPGAATTVPGKRRLGESSDSKRKLQEAAPPTLAEFGMTVGINAVNDGPGALAQGSGASVLGFTVTVMGLIVSLLL